MKYTIKQDWQKSENNHGVLEMSTVSVGDVLPREKYAVCLVKGRAKNRSQAVKNVFSMDLNTRYSKGSGYWRSQCLLAEHALSEDKVYVSFITGQQYLDNLPGADAPKHLLFLEREWDIYADWLYGCRGVQDANTAHHARWDKICVTRSFESGFERRDRRLPRQIANGLIDQHNWEVNSACIRWFAECVRKAS